MTAEKISDGTSCVFCKIAAGEIPSSKVYEDKDVLAFLDIKPVNPGHTLVIPKKHFQSIHDTPDELVAKMSVAAKKIAGAIQRKLGAEGVNIGMNNGRAAGQVVFHAHIHVMPRYGKDSFKLWIGKEYAKGEREKTAEKIKSGLVLSPAAKPSGYYRRLQSNRLSTDKNSGVESWKITVTGV